MHFTIRPWMSPMLAGAMLLGVAASAQANLVTNGGFETGDFTGWTLAGNTGFTGIDGDAHSGNFAAFLGAVGSNTLLSQTLATTTGASYTLTFFLANDGGSPNNFSVSFDGQNLVGGGSPGLPIVNGPGFPYTEYSFNVTALDNAAVLQFQDRQDPAFWHLDDVSVTPNQAVPEPATLTIFGSALAGLAFIRRRRKAA